VKKNLKVMLVSVLVLLAGCNGGAWSSGDRVLVAKFPYEAEVQKPRRFDVVVFKYPERPFENGSPKNYIKRLLGLPGQILAIFFGQLFWWEPGPGQPSPYEEDLRTVPANDLWKPEYMHVDDAKSRKLFEAGDFKIMRKPPDVMMALRRIVYDNDFQARDLGLEYKRWKPAVDSSWEAGNDFRDFQHKSAKNGGIDWLRYQHLLRPGLFQGPQDVKPQLITDFEAYNNFALAGGGARSTYPNWVGDLMLECDLMVDTAQGSFFMELSKGIYRYRAHFDLEKGTCALLRQGPAEQKADKWEELSSKTTDVKKPGTYSLRFANFDSRLTVWVGRALPFGDGVEFHPPEMRAKGEDPTAAEKRRGPTRNDLEPASIGSQGAPLQVQHLRLWRDTYYTLRASDSGDVHLREGDLSNPDAWDEIRKLPFRTMYVQPGHYLCLGDNSPASSDSRQWGLVPERLMLGRALLVYFPFDRAGAIR
jgi:Signal peptidase, peptidase S26